MQSAIVDLDAVLKSSLAKASPHTRNVYGQNPLTGEEIVEMANTRSVQTPISTIGLNGRPHLTPSDVVGLNGVLYVGVDEATAHYANMKRNPVIALMIMDGRKRQAILEGTVVFLDMTSSAVGKVQELQRAKNGWTTGALVELRPEKAFSWRAKQA